MNLNLVHPKRKRMFEVFLHHNIVKFNVIEKETGFRSNEVAYLLNQFIREGVIKKNQELYQLGEHAEQFVPFFVQSMENLSPLPVVLIAYRHGEKILVLRRTKKPYLDYWGLPGGRIRVHETIEEAASRIMHEKAFVHGAYKGVNAIIHEQHNVSKIMHAYFLFLVTIEGEHIKDVPGRKWTTLSGMDSLAMIPSDRWFAQHKLGETISIPHEIVDEKEDGLILQVSDNIKIRR